MTFPTRLKLVGWLAALTIGLGLQAAPLLAQATGSIRGRVTAANSLRPLTGAQISIPGTGRGSLTNAQGEYLIVNVPAGPQTVRVQMIGFTSDEAQSTVAAGQTATVDFQLSESAIALDEVVVTGTAGAARRREIGNSISQVKLEEVVEPVQDVADLLQGRAAGVSIISSSGSVGSGSSIRLRGTTSVALSNQPLVYIDGVRIRSDAYPKNVPASGFQGRSANVTASPLSDINPNDIERIEVIKGAAATTLYGTEAAAGVIQIFTKRGATGAPTWTVETNQGFARLRPFAPDVLPENFGLPELEYGQAQYLFIDPWLRDGWQQRYSGSVTGGGEAVQYFVSGSYDDNEGVLPLDEEQKYVVRGNFTFRPFEDLTLLFNTSYTNDDITQTPSGNNAHGLTLNAFRRDRNYHASYDIDKISQALEYEITSGIDRLIIGGTATYAPMENFTHRFTVGLDQANIENRQLRPFGYFAAPQGIISNQRWSAETLTLDYVGSFQNNFGPALSSTFSWGAQSSTVEESDITAYSENFPGVPVPTVTAGSVEQSFENRERVINAGIFLQELLGFQDRYFLTLGMRVDGNSAFGQDFGLQLYPKVSGSWVLSEEPFWNEGWGTMKLRAAYGQAGRAPGAFDAVRTWEAVGWGTSPAFFPQNEGNPELGPETTAETELGFDAGFFNQRLGLDFTYFYARTTDALFQVRRLPSLGNWDDQLENVGEIENSGFEVAANASLIQTPTFGWDLGLTVSTVNSNVISLGGAPEFGLGNFGWVIEGESVPVIRGDKIINEDLQMDPIEVASESECGANQACIVRDAIYGPNQPTHTIGLNTTLSLPYGIQLSARGEYLGGHYISDGPSSAALSRSVQWPTCFGAYEHIAANQSDQLTAWERMACIPRNVEGDWFIQPADFAKLRDVTVRVPIGRLVPMASNATFSLSASNWYTWKKDFPILDPEVAGNDGFDGAVRGSSEHIPSPATLIASLRFVF